MYGILSINKEGGGKYFVLLNKSKFKGQKNIMKITKKKENNRFRIIIWIVYLVMFTILILVASAEKKLLEAQVDKVLLTVNYVTRKMKWFGYVVD